MKNSIPFYPISIYLIEELDDDPYYLAYHPDFGEAACGAIGESIEEALSKLEHVKADVIDYYAKNGKALPEPSKAELETVR